MSSTGRFGSRKAPPAKEPAQRRSFTRGVLPRGRRRSALAMNQSASVPERASRVLLAAASIELRGSHPNREWLPLALALADGSYTPILPPVCLVIATIDGRGGMPGL